MPDQSSSRAPIIAALPVVLGLAAAGLDLAGGGTEPGIVRPELDADEVLASFTTSERALIEEHVFGGLPALLIGFIRYGVRESAKWEERFGKDEHKRPKMSEAFARIFSATYLRRTMVMSGLFLVSIIGLWAGSIYVPTAVTQVAVRTGSATADAARLASYGGMLLAIGTIVGCVVAPVRLSRA